MLGIYKNELSDIISESRANLTDKNRTKLDFSGAWHTQAHSGRYSPTFVSISKIFEGNWRFVALVKK